MNHTPTPWTIKRHDLGDEEYCLVPQEIIGADKFKVVSSEGGLAPDSEWTKELLEANADFIVTACNAHDRFVELLQESSSKIHAEFCGLNHDSLCQEIDEALAKAGIKEREK